MGLKGRFDFPGKFFFARYSPRALSGRMHKLEMYLNRLAQGLDLLEYPCAWEFLEIDSWSRELLVSLQCSEEVSLPLTCEPCTKSLCIKEFLTLLETKPMLLSSAVKAFESLYFDSDLKFTVAEIEELLWGNHKLNGLLFHCGNHYNLIGATSCLDLLVKFLKYELNSLEADKFATVYANTNPLAIKKMDLGLHIRKGTCKDCAGLLAVHYYLVNNNFNLSKASDLLSDEAAIQQYESWENVKHFPKVQAKKWVTKDTRSDSKASNDTEESEYGQTITPKATELVQYNQVNKAVLKVA
eukprot:TRINITY_DN1412_c0_g1_i7.p1 TRINITY_DN1412_c0_g1~~TRINITY_DN1412_c0_g1_i7.p1  ORF type:complete len:298 (-),score=50.49 TRINITY_DN1412_c0_g1_i7:803-1696(-)